jgi:hypothetical protein
MVFFGCKAILLWLVPVSKNVTLLGAFVTVLGNTHVRAEDDSSPNALVLMS